MKKLINQIQSAARAFSSAALSLAAGVALLGSTIGARAAAQPPYIGAFAFVSNTAPNLENTISGDPIGAHEWEIELGNGQIDCDQLEFVCERGTNAFEYAYVDMSYYTEPVLGISTVGSNKYIYVQTAFDYYNPYYNQYYLTYEDSYYSDCTEQGGYVHIYNP